MTTGRRAPALTVAGGGGYPPTAAEPLAHRKKITDRRMARDRGQADGAAFRFRVSDAFDVPLRGTMLRLRTVEGRPRIREVSPGRRLQLVRPDGRQRDITVRDLAATGGRQTQDRLDRIRELDIVISLEDAGTGDDRVDIGWIAAGPRTG